MTLRRPSQMMKAATHKPTINPIRGIIVTHFSLGSLGSLVHGFTTCSFRTRRLWKYRGPGGSSDLPPLGEFALARCGTCSGLDMAWGAIQGVGSDPLRCEDCLGWSREGSMDDKLALEDVGESMVFLRCMKGFGDWHASILSWCEQVSSPSSKSTYPLGLRDVYKLSHRNNLSIHFPSIFVDKAST